MSVSNNAASFASIPSTPSIAEVDPSTPATLREHIQSAQQHHGKLLHDTNVTVLEASLGTKLQQADGVATSCSGDVDEGIGSFGWVLAVDGMTLVHAKGWQKEIAHS